MAASQIPRAPAGLGTRGKALWQRVHRENLLDAIESEQLHQMCAVADRCDRGEKELAGQPLMTYGSTGQPRVNPLLGALREDEKLLDRYANSLGVSLPTQAGATRGSGAKRKAAQTRWSRANKAASVTSIRGA